MERREGISKGDERRSEIFGAIAVGCMHPICTWKSNEKCENNNHLVVNLLYVTNNHTKDVHHHVVCGRACVCLALVVAR